jgi:hypothetical protein
MSLYDLISSVNLGEDDILIELKDESPPCKNDDERLDYLVEQEERIRQRGPEDHDLLGDLTLAPDQIDPKITKYYVAPKPAFTFQSMLNKPKDPLEKETVKAHLNRIAPNFLPFLETVGDSCMIVAGGAISAPMNEGFRQDVDVFVYGLTPQMATEKVKRLFQLYLMQLQTDYHDTWSRCHVAIHQTPQLVKLVGYLVDKQGKYQSIEIQVILRLYRNIAEILFGFDMPVSSFGFGYVARTAKLFATPLAYWCHQRSVNVFNPANHSPSWLHRLCKYKMRGFRPVYYGLKADVSEITTQYIPHRYHLDSGYAPILSDYQHSRSDANQLLTDFVLHPEGNGDECSLYWSSETKMHLKFLRIVTNLQYSLHRIETIRKLDLALAGGTGQLLHKTPAEIIAMLPKLSPKELAKRYQQEVAKKLFRFKWKTVNPGEQRHNGSFNYQPVTLEEFYGRGNLGCQRQP